LSVAALLLWLFAPVDIRSVGIRSGCGIAPRLLWPFFHAGFFHVAINLFCLLSIVFLTRVRMGRLLLSLLVCFTLPVDTMGAFVPMTVPTVGLSGAVYFLLGTFLFEVRERAYYLLCIAINLGIGFFNPASNFWLHLYCFVIGLLWALITKPYLRYDRRSIKHPARE
jgi:membrane associated rhomboid family serine protease